MWTAAFAPDQLMSWEIIPETDGCRLILRQQIADESLLGRTTAGWHVCLDRMQAILDGQTAAEHMSSWPPLFEHYKAVLAGLGVKTEQQGAPPAKT
jgi:hypothetical protein